MDLTLPIDQYCERTDFSLLSEPLNLLTNAGFIAAAYYLNKSFSKKNALLRPGAKLLNLIIFVIGVGSALFHSFANRWSMISDVAPIALFIFCYFWLYLRHVVGLPKSKTLGGLLLFAVLSSIFIYTSDPIKTGGSHSYFGAWIMLFGLSCFWLCYSKKSQWDMMLGFLLLTVGIMARSVDETLCELNPIGTHFIWHLCNSLMLFLITRAYGIKAEDR
jgi:hypothetical protein